MSESGEISSQARAWQAQLQAQGLRPRDACRIAQREAGWQGWALEERLAARDPARWYGPDSPEARKDPDVREPTQTEYARRNGAKRMTPFEIPDLVQAADVAAEFDPRCLENEEAHWQQRQAEAAEPEAGP